MTDHTGSLAYLSVSDYCVGFQTKAADCKLLPSECRWNAECAISVRLSAVLGAGLSSDTYFNGWACFHGDAATAKERSIGFGAVNKLPKVPKKV